MAYTARNDWSGDEGRHDDQVHYRLFVGYPDSSPAVICMQDFDYLDTDARRILSPEVYETEADAERGLIDLLPAIGKAEATLPASLDRDMRARMLATLVRDSIKEAQR